MAQLCIDLGGTAIKLGLMQDDAVIATEEFPVRGSAEDLLHAEHRAHALLSLAPVNGVGIAVPGAVDRGRRQLVRAHGKYEYLAGVDLPAWAEARFGAPASIENDARAALLGEAAFGCAVNERDVVMVTLGTGIGTAALVHNALLRGAHEHAGILGGHLTVDLGGPVCPCGNIGCAEAMASTWVLDGLLRQHPGISASVLADALEGADRVGIRALVDAASAPAPDRLAGEILERFIRVWGAVIVSLCHSYDPDLVVVSGGVMRSRDILLPLLQRYVSEHLWSSSFRPRLVSPHDPELSVLRGLAVVAQRATSGRHSSARNHSDFE